MSTQRILVQLDPDRHASVFDAVVAIDSQVDHLLQYAGVEPEVVRGLVHGAIFTRSPAELKNTAVFIGGSSVSAGEAVLAAVCKSFVGPMRCSVMFDGNGSNTTAAAAVLSAAKHVPLAGARAIVLGGTGPVGSRIARLVAGQGGHACVVSRESSKAEALAQQLRERLGDKLTGSISAIGSSDPSSLRAQLQLAQVLYACGAAGVQLISTAELANYVNLQVAIDLNAVPPAGVEGISVMDKAVARGNRIDYGAIGVGGLKMKIHRAAIATLFTRNDAILDAEEIFGIGQTL